MRYINTGLLTFAVCLMTMTSCETDIPPVDTDDPTLVFAISGPGISRNFTETDDWSLYQINVLAGATYQCSVWGADEGGVSQVQWQLIQDLELTDIQPAETQNLTPSPLSRVLRLSGDASSPLTAQIITADLSADASLANNFFTMTYGVYDFSSNSLFDALNFSVVQSDPGVVFSN